MAQRIIHNFEEGHDFSKPSEGIELNKQYLIMGNHKYVRLELFSPPCTNAEVLEKKIVELDMNKKQTESEVK